VKCNKNEVLGERTKETFSRKETILLQVHAPPTATCSVTHTSAESNAASKLTAHTGAVRLRWESSYGSILCADGEWLGRK